MTKWKDRTRGGFAYEIFAEREEDGVACLYGRYKFVTWYPVCWRSSDGKVIDSLPIWSCDLIPADDPLSESFPELKQTADDLLACAERLQRALKP